MQRREPRCAAEPLSDRGRPEQHDHRWRNNVDLPVEPKLPAHVQFIVTWRSILRRAALHAVRQKDPGTRQPNLAQHLIDEPAGSANERTAFGVFGLAGCFTDEHHGCR
jgi:hypothetical protein